MLEKKKVSIFSLWSQKKGEMSASLLSPLYKKNTDLCISFHHYNMLENRFLFFLLFKKLISISKQFPDTKFSTKCPLYLNYYLFRSL